MNGPLSRRQAIGVLAAPFLAAACRDLTGPDRFKPSVAALTDRVSLIGAGDQHGAAYKTGRAVSKVGTMIGQALEADPNAWVMVQFEYQ